MRPKADIPIQTVCPQRPQSKVCAPLTVFSNVLPLLKLPLGLQGLWTLMEQCSLCEGKIKLTRRCQGQVSQAFKLIMQRLQMDLPEFLLLPRSHWLHECHRHNDNPVLSLSPHVASARVSGCLLPPSASCSTGKCRQPSSWTVEVVNTHLALAACSPERLIGFSKPA